MLQTFYEVAIFTLNTVNENIKMMVLVTPIICPSLSNNIQPTEIAVCFLLLAVDHGLVNAVVFIDLKKAFDTVDHDILLSKLQHYGITGASNR